MKLSALGISAPVLTMFQTPACATDADTKINRNANGDMTENTHTTPLFQSIEEILSRCNGATSSVSGHAQNGNLSRTNSGFSNGNDPASDRILHELEHRKGVESKQSLSTDMLMSSLNPRNSAILSDKIDSPVAGSTYEDVNPVHTPRMALSLGLSSLSLRVPMATPGSVGCVATSITPNPNPGLNYTGAFQGTGTINSHSSNASDGMWGAPATITSNISDDFVIRGRTGSMGSNGSYDNTNMHMMSTIGHAHRHDITGESQFSYPDSAESAKNNFSNMIHKNRTNSACGSACVDSSAHADMNNLHTTTQTQRALFDTPGLTPIKPNSYNTEGKTGQKPDKLLHEMDSMSMSLGWSRNNMSVANSLTGANTRNNTLLSSSGNPITNMELHSGSFGEGHPDDAHPRSRPLSTDVTNFNHTYCVNSSDSDREKGFRKSRVSFGPTTTRLSFSSEVSSDVKPIDSDRNDQSDVFEIADNVMLTPKGDGEGRGGTVVKGPNAASNRGSGEGIGLRMPMEDEELMSHPTKFQRRLVNSFMDSADYSRDSDRVASNTDPELEAFYSRSEDDCDPHTYMLKNPTAAGYASTDTDENTGNIHSSPGTKDQDSNTRKDTDVYGIAGVNSNPTNSNRRTVHLSPMLRKKWSGNTNIQPVPNMSSIKSCGASAEKEKQRYRSNSMDKPIEDLKVKAIAIYLVFVKAISFMNLYECAPCEAILQQLPMRHFSSGLVQYMLGVCYYEMHEYKSCVVALKEMVKLECYRLKGLEVLSTALWHLRRDKELCGLAQQVVEVDKYAPETWCVVGNCFSLQHEAEVAIKFFERALQIDPNFTYAYSLCGHEYMSNEDLEKAIICFRHAIRCDDRHYNAWYGLGAIYYRQEQLDLSEQHFRKALSINSLSSILKCYMSMVLHAQNSMSAANEEDGECGYSLSKELEAYNILHHATIADPTNPQLQFQCVHVLLSLDSYTSLQNDETENVQDGQDEAEVDAYLSRHPYLIKAIHALHILEGLVPKEPPIYSLLGQIYHQKLNNIQIAMKYYNIAIDLDPKESHALKVRKL